MPIDHIIELHWWQVLHLPGSEVSFTCAPSHQYSVRNIIDRDATLRSSLVIRNPRHSLFFSGDTGLTSEYQTIRDRLGPFDLIMLEIGAFHPAWGDMHLGPENAMKAHSLLGGGALLPIHWATFRLSTHTWDQPAEVLYTLAERNDVPLLMPILGQAIEPTHQEKPDTWWRRVETQGEPLTGLQQDTPPKNLLHTQQWPLD